MRSEAYLATWKTYQAAWSDIASAERRRLLESSVTRTCMYNDPLSVADGLDALIGRIEQAQRVRPGISFRNDKLIDHHGQALSYWTMLDMNGVEVLKGASYARFGEDGRLTHMTGFFELPPKVDEQVGASPHT